MRKKRTGFVLIELVVVLGMVALLIGIAANNIFGSRNKALLGGVVDTLTADIRSQQTKAMTGVTQGGVPTPAYGVRFEPTQYILFSGLTYNPADPTNSVIALDSGVTFSTISLPNSSIVFALKSGEFIGFATASSSLSIREENSGEVKTIQFNPYGIITSIN